MSALTILAEECELLNDSKYRSYITQVEKALKNFEYTSEWADLISALGKLNKVLVGHTKYPVIPKRVTIGKRLAQCLHPALPSGVHLKALETYDIILKCIGTQRLAQDLFIYSAGLFPLLGHAAMSVKPVLLTVYERHFVPLGKHIKPGLNGLLLGLLPGLEEGSEFYDRTTMLLDDFCVAVEPEYYYTCLWECVMSCPSVRLPAISYLLSHYNKKQSMEDQLHMMGLNIDLMVEAVCRAIQDINVLVQRSLLDFLLLAFPMHNGQLTKSDMAKIVQAVVNVVLRRDMSLNRRLYSWLLGSSVPNAAAIANQSDSLKVSRSDSVSTSSEMDLSYFQTFSRDLLIQALKLKLSAENEEEEEDGKFSGKLSILKPFRILMSLLDKPEIGPVILESVLLAVFRCLYRECGWKGKSKYEQEVVNSRSSSKQAEKSTEKDGQTNTELIKTANLLFATFEPYFIWDYIARLFEQTCVCSTSGKKLSRSVSKQLDLPPTLPELCTLVEFLTDTITLETFLETQTEHLPDLLLRVMSSLSANCDDVSDEDVSCVLSVCLKLLSKVQPSVNAIGIENDLDEEVPDTFPEESAPLTADTEETDLGLLPVEKGITSPHGTESKPKDSNKASDWPGEKVEEESQRSHVTTSVKDKLRRLSSVTQKSQHFILMQSCVETYQNFFNLYTSKGILKDVALTNRFMGRIAKSAKMSKSPDSESEKSCNEGYMREKNSSQEFLVDRNCVEEDTITTYKCACKLLIDFSSFPIYCTNYHRVVKRTQSRDHEPLPHWLQSLITVSCALSNFELQSAAIAALLDLILLTQSTQPASLDCSTSCSGGTVSVVILPALPPCHLRYLEDHTNFYTVLAETVWSFMDSGCSPYHQRAVELFYLLHQVAPSTWTCEDVIGHALITEDEVSRIEAFKRFTVLWHLTRDVKLDVNPGHPPRMFDRSMFVLLDSLKEDSSPLKTIASTWLTHIVQRGDISRVLNPLLLMLLHPDTARISVQHVNIHTPRNVRVSESSEDNSEAKIYAISSEGGHIIYHMSTDNKKIGQRVSDELRSMALVTSDQGSTSVARANEHSDQEFSFDRVQADNLNLRINPWGSEISLDRSSDGFDLPAQTSANVVDFVGTRRLDKETCAKEGIFFDGEESSQHSIDDQGPAEDEKAVDDASPDDVVREILDMILDNMFGNESQNSETGPEIEKTKHHIVERAESVMSKSSSVLEDRDILNSIDKRGMEMDSPTASEVDLTKDEGNPGPDCTDVHPLHMHMLLYTQPYDYRRTLYALTTLKSVLVTCSRQVVTSMVTTSISSIRPSHLAKLQILLARHRKSVFGKNFFGELPPEVMSNYRSNMFIEIIISVCLYFVRSYYPNLMKRDVTLEELGGNKEVHIVATEVLTQLISELVIIMKESGKHFMSYIKDLLNRCKLQKALLHCCIASVYNSRKPSHSEYRLKVTEAIIQYNEADLSPAANETFQVRLLNLLLVTIVLEAQVEKKQGNTDLSTPTSSEWDRPKVNFYASLMNAKFNIGQPIVQQGMFVSFVLSALKQKHMGHMHHHWISMVTSALPYIGNSLTAIVMNVVSQLCRNIEALARTYLTTDIGPETRLPPDHIVTLLEGLTTVCHYCLLDNSPPVSVGLTTPPSSSGSAENSGPGQIFTNLIHVFNPVSNSRETSPQKELGPSPVQEARRGLLSIMPRIMACMASMWSAVRSVERQRTEDHPMWTMGSPKVIKKCILEFISPISRPHGPHLLAAMGVAWNDSRKKTAGANSKFTAAPCEDQLLLVDLISAIRVLPTDTLVQTVNKVLKQPPQTELGKNKKGIPLEVNMLQFFYAYVQHTSAGQLMDSWSSLMTLLRDGMQLNLSPPGKFILLQVLNEFVQKMPTLEDKKNQKELQDVTQRLLEMIGLIAGSSLEQTTWLRRNLAVKPGKQNDKPELEEEETDIVVEEMKERKVVDPKLPSAIDSKYSVQALGLLAELMAPLLDVVYSSEEKDKVASFLTTILYNVFPYLRNHSVNNLPSFRACSQILSSISSYQYSRKSWKREALELLLDQGFFQMDLRCIGYWRCVIDNLMTHDKTTFKDLMNRVTITQSGSLNLFSSKEQELEQRAVMLKRLAFTLFCSEKDQYQKSMPEIQERLAESLRVTHQVPSIMAHVFLCVRVLILRMSSHQLTSLWPTVITEMVHVFMQIEQELSNDTDEFKTSVQRIAALDSSWAHLGNGLNAHNNPSWLQLYLSVCKLLDLALALPADVVPQFQLYRWAFIGGAAAGNDTSEDKVEEEEEEEEDMVGEKPKPRKKGEKPREKPKKASKKQHKFIPHIIRLTKLMNERVRGATPLLKRTPGRPLLTQTYLRSLAELQPFFNTLCHAGQSDHSLLLTSQRSGHSSHNRQRQNGLDGLRRDLPKSKSTPARMDKLPSSQQQSISNRQFIEDIIERDFLEQCPV